MEEEIEQIKITISKLEHLVRVSNSRITKLEEQVVSLVWEKAERAGATVTFDDKQSSVLGKSIGQLHRDNVNVTNYPLYGGPGVEPSS